MAAIKSINLLPEIFKSDANRKFLAATVDQLISEPALTKIDGFVGRKFAPTYRSGDSYIQEPTADRQNYQLEPSVVVQNTASGDTTFYSSYPDLIKKIQYYGGLTNNHSRLFEGESYNFDGLIDFDKFVNFNQYLWLPGGPPEVAVSANSNVSVLDFIVHRDSTQQAFTLTGSGTDPNPIVTLVKGTKYTFRVNQPGHPFWLQTSPGASGTRSIEAEILSRQIFGVENNGDDIGLITFTVPASTAQDSTRLAVRIAEVDFATSLTFAQLQNRMYSVVQKLGGIDGLVNSTLDGSTVILVNPNNDSDNWTDPGVFDFDLFDQGDFQQQDDNGKYYTPVAYEAGDTVATEQRRDIFRIRVIKTSLTDGLIRLEHITKVGAGQKVYVKNGTTNAGVEFYKDTDGLWYPVRQITAPLTEIYYQDGSSDFFGGRIKLIEPDQATIDVEKEIIGKTNYTSPNGVKLSNGMKIRFDATVTPVSYTNNVYIVEGVGSGIRLVNSGNLIVPESYILKDQLSVPDYITISRGSLDLNAWSRSNRWFHSGLIEMAAVYNNDPTLRLAKAVRATRPIIEFEPNIYLFNYGQLAKAPIDILDFSVTDAFTQVEGKEKYIIQLPNNLSQALTAGTRIVFGNDIDPDVRNRIYRVDFITTTERTQIHLVSQNTNLLPTYQVSGAQLVEDVSVAFVGGNPDQPASANIIVDDITGTITDVIFSDFGAGYRSKPVVTFVGGGAGIGGRLDITLSGGDTGTISSYKLVSGGEGYSTAPVYGFVPTVNFSKPVPGIGAVVALGEAVMVPTTVSNIIVEYGGLNYIADPYLEITTTYGTQADIKPIYSAFNYVDYIRITNPGVNVGEVRITISSPNDYEATANYANTVSFTTNIINLETVPVGIALETMVYGPGVTGGTTLQSVAIDSVRISHAAEVKDNNFYVFAPIGAAGVTSTQIYGNTNIFSSAIVQLTSVTGVSNGKQVFGDGVVPGTLVTNVDTQNNIITLDTPANLKNGRVLTFKSATSKSATVTATSRFSSIINVDNSAVAAVNMYVTGGTSRLSINSVSLSFPAQLDVGTQSTLIRGDQIIIRGLDSTIELNNNTYYVIPNSDAPGILVLYSDPDLQYPVDSRNYTSFTSGGYVAPFSIDYGVTVTKILDANTIEVSSPVSLLAGTQLVFIGKTAIAKAKTDISNLYAISITDPGSGYKTVPTISLSYASGNSGSIQPAAVAVMNDNVLDYFKILNPGTGYQIGNSISAKVINNLTATTADTTVYGTRTLTFASADAIKYVKEGWLAFLIIDFTSYTTYTDFARTPYVSTTTTGPNFDAKKPFMDVGLTTATVLSVDQVVNNQIILNADIHSLDADQQQIDLPAGTKMFFTAKSRFFTYETDASSTPIGDIKSDFIITLPVFDSKIIYLNNVSGIQHGMVVTDLSGGLPAGLTVISIDAVDRFVVLSSRINSTAGVPLQFTSIAKVVANLKSTKISNINVTDGGAEYTSAPIITVAPAITPQQKIATSVGTDTIEVPDLGGIVVGMTVSSEYNIDGSGVTTGSTTPKVISTSTVQTGTATFRYFVQLNYAQPVFTGLLTTFTLTTSALAQITSLNVVETITGDTTPDTYEAGNTVLIALPTVGKSTLKQSQTGVDTYNQYWFDGINWLPSQQKTGYNQAPLFDIFDKNGISASDTSVYLGSKFAGTKVFGYKVGTGKADSILGFPLGYKNFQGQIGDIEFANYFDTDSFVYLVNKIETLKTINSLYLKQKSTSGFAYRNMWSQATEKSKQYQIISQVFDGNTNYFEIDVSPAESKTIPYVKVYVDGKILSESSFQVTTYKSRRAVVVDVNYLTQTPASKVDILIYSKSTSSLGYYQIPSNLDFNSNNSNFSSLTLGQLRQHLVTMSQNHYGVSGQILGNNNLRDLGIKNWTGSILQNASPVMYSAAFLGDGGLEAVSAIEYAQREYSRFKNKFLDQAVKLDLDIKNPSVAVDQLMNVINVGKNTSMPWYDSDMVPYGSSTTTNIKVVDARQTRYQIPRAFDDTVISRRSVLIYLYDSATKRRRQLIKGLDFMFNPSISAIDIMPQVVLTYTTTIEIVDRPSTVGCYIPETPTKLGLYPSFVPQIYIDDTYQIPQKMIQGHDGSVTPAFEDFRDEFLLELELRIYNNIKVDYQTTLIDIVESIPGKYREINYSRQEFNQLLTRNFLRWVGTNQISYSKNDTFDSGNSWTWNYKFLKDSTGEFLPGFWRGIYEYYYDTDRPHMRPWEMLGFTDRPVWWEEYYGPAPYTGTNKVLWDDLEAGYVAEGPRRGTNSQFARPGLGKMIPVDEHGQLLSPEKVFPISFNSDGLASAWGIGDRGPVETAWRRSSEYPYALQIAIALSRPGFYFGTMFDVTSYQRDLDLDQLVVAGSKQRVNKNTFSIPDDGIASGTVVLTAGYVNWVRDWFNGKSKNGTATIKSIVNNLQVKLSYRMAGYSDSKFLTVLADQSSPVSGSSSIVVPAENYKIFLNKSTPVSRIVYSAVIVEQTANGYTVSGYDLENPYFTIIPSQASNNSYTINAINETAVIFKDFQPIKLVVPYGYEFINRQQIVDFLISYGRYLVGQGMVFDAVNSDLETAQDWVLSSKEFLTWSQQGWASGNILVLSPAFNSIKIVNELGIIDNVENVLTGSKILDQNFAIIKSNQFSVVRDENTFTLTSVFGQTIGLADLNVVQYEHVLLLDNSTVFNDVIYLPEIGDRQYRLRLVGHKTNNWSGQLNPGGFIYNSDKVDVWKTGQNYKKGTLLSFKDNYYYATTEIAAATEFNFAKWTPIEKNKIKTGMLSNFAYNAEKFNNIYDIDNQAADSQLDALSQGIVGFRSRNYFQDFKLDTVSQTKFYQGFIRQKGTVNSIDALTSGQFDNISSSINLYEEWGLRVGDYGALGSNQSIELELDESKFVSNPSTSVLLGPVDTAQDGLINFKELDVYKYSTDTFNANIIQTRIDLKPRISDAITAGYPRLDDIDATVFDITDYRQYYNLVPKIGAGFKLWTAKDFNKSWNVYRASETNVIVSQLSIGLDNQFNFTTETPHGLAINDLFVIKNFDADFDGFYRVISITDSTNGTVLGYRNVDKLKAQQTKTGSGVLLVMQSVRFERINELVNYTPLHNWRDQDRVWVDNDTATDIWAVFEKNNGWNFDQVSPLRQGDWRTNEGYGLSVKLNQSGLLSLAGAKDSTTGGISGVKIVSSGFLYEAPAVAVSLPEQYGGVTSVVTASPVSGTLLETRLTTKTSPTVLTPSAPVSNSAYVYVSSIAGVFVGDTVTGTDGAGHTIPDITYLIEVGTNYIRLNRSITWSTTAGYIITASRTGYDMLPNVSIVDRFSTQITNKAYQVTTLDLSSVYTQATKNAAVDSYNRANVTLTNINDIWVGDIVTGSDGTGNVISTGAGILVANINYTTNLVSLTSSISWNIANNSNLTFRRPAVFENDVITGSDGTGNVIFTGTTVSYVSLALNQIIVTRSVTLNNAATVTFTRGSSGNVQCRLAPTTVANIEIINSGSGFRTAPIVEIVGGGGTGATATIDITSSGALVNPIITNPGSGYTSPPEINLVTTTPNSGANIRIRLTQSSVTSFVIGAEGSGYKTPQLVITTAPDGKGSGVTGNVNVTNKSISNPLIRVPGVGYQSTPTITITDGAGPGTGATAAAVFATGTVKTFLDDGSGTVTQIQNISQFGYEAKEFGYALDIGTNYAFVGSPGAFDNQGTVTVSQSSGSAWANKQILYPTDENTNARFGESVVVTKNQRWAYIGAPGENKVYVYARKQTPTNQRKITVISGQASYLTDLTFIRQNNELRITGSSGRIFEAGFDFNILAGVITFSSFGTIETEQYLYVSQRYPTTIIQSPSITKDSPLPYRIKGVLQTSYLLNTIPQEIDQISVVGSDGRLFIAGRDYALFGKTLTFLNNEFTSQASINVSILDYYYVLIKTLEPDDNTSWISSPSTYKHIAIAGTVDTYSAMSSQVWEVNSLIKVLNKNIDSSYDSYQIYSAGYTVLNKTPTGDVVATRLVPFATVDNLVLGDVVTGTDGTNTIPDNTTVSALFTNNNKAQLSSSISWIFATNSPLTFTRNSFTLRGTENRNVTRGVGRFGESIAITADGYQIVIGAPGVTVVDTDSVTNTNAGKVYVFDRLYQAFTGAGGSSTVYTTSQDLSVATYITVDGIELVENVDYTASRSTIQFNTPPRNGARIRVDVNTFNIIQSIETPNPVVSGKFGKAVSISPDNSNIFIGAPGYRDVDYYNGRVYRYINQGLVFGEIVSTNINPATVLSDSIRINDIEVSLSNSATLTTKLIKDINSKNITGVTSRTDGVSGVEFTEQSGLGYFASNVSAVIAGPDIGKGWPATVGSITLNPNGSISTVTIANSGAGYTISPTITFFGGNLSTAIGTTVLDSAPLKIYTTSAARLKSINILPAIGTGLADIGLQVYYPAQIFQHPNLGVPEKYGTVVTIDQDTGETLLIGSEGAATLKTSTFDKNSTLFDKDTTKFVDVLKNSGAVYVYDYLPIPGETLASPSKYLFNQDLQNSKILFGDNFGSSIAVAGNKILVGASTSSYYVTNSGLVHIFKNTTGKKGWTKLRQRTPRVDIDYINQAIVYDKKLQIVDAQLDYLDPAKGKILGIADQDLDYKTVYDPAVYNKGSNEAITIDTLSPWTEIQVGQTWWNLDACRLIDYEQGDLNYRVAHWGDYFPESIIEVLEWVESLVLPSEYSGIANGEAKYADNSAYVESAFLDTQSGLIKTKYYYWVKNKTTVDTVATHRTNSIKTLEKLISDPTGQGIPYMAVIASNAISIFNINSLLGANNKILKIEYAQTLNQSISHSEFELVQQNNSLSLIPDKLIEKLIDSMSGENSIGEVVPDLRLKDNSKLGISRRPRQTMIQYTDAAIKIFVEYVNAFLMQNLATQLFDLSGLITYEPFPPNASGYYNEKVATLDQLYYIDLVNLLQGHKVLVEADSEHEGFWTIYEYFPENVIQWQLNRIQSYDSTRYWQYADWYATGYDQNIKIDYIVQEFKDIAPLDALTGSVVKILDNGIGNFELYLLVANSTPQIVGVQNGTIQLKTNLYDGNESLVGFDNASFDSIGFSKTSAIELRNIISGLFSGVFTGINQVEINKLFFVMVNYILSEQRSVDWVFKSSFISVLHQIRKLEKFPSYIKDQQSYFEDYINEVKPYRTQIRNYLLDYQGFDTALQGVSDFDLLPVFDAKLGVYRALDTNNITDLALIKSTSSKSWLDNYTYSIQAIRIVNGGTGYASAPRIEITGGGGTGAVATATIDISTGELIDINVINAGSGFTSQPTVNFYGGSGTGAKAYVDFAQSSSTVTIDTKNKKTRSITTQLNFDRTAYQSSVSQWKSYTTYHPGDIVAVPDVVLTTFVNLPDQLLPRYTNAYQIQPNKKILGSQTVNFNIFQDETVAIKLSGRDITNALDRLALYNKPGSPDIARIFSSPDTQRLDSAAINDLARSAGNEWNAVTHSQVVPATHEYQYLAVGNRSLLAISQDGITWELIIVNENFVNLQDACFFNGKTWVAVGNQASLLLSDNGVNWTKEVVDKFSFSPTVDNPTGAVQQNISQALDFTSVAYIDSARGNYVIAVGNSSNVLMNPYNASVDIPQGWYSAKPQSKLFVVPAQFLKVYSKSFGPLTNIDGTTYNVLLQLSGYSTISASPLALTLREGFVIIGGVNGNMFITSYARLDDLMQGYANSYNYDSGKRTNTNYPWVPMSVPTEIIGDGDGVSGEQIQSVAISDITDRWIVAVGSAGTLLWNRLDSPIRIQAGSSDLGSDTINTTVVDHDINVFANFRYFNASNFVAPLTKDSISKINLTDITWDGEKFIVVGDSSTVIWGYPGSQSNASIEIGNVNPNVTAVTLLPTARWTTVTSGTSVTITVPVADLKGPVLTGMIVSAVGLPTDSVVSSSSVSGSNYLIVVNFATATFSSATSKALSLLYAVTSSIPANTVLTFTGPDGQIETLTTSRTTTKGSRTIDVSDFAGVISPNWTVSGIGIPINAVVLQVKKFAEFTWQYAKGSGRDINVDYNSVSVNLTTFKITNPLIESTNFVRSQAGSTIIAGDLITLFDSTGTKIQVTATQTLLPGVSIITISPSDLVKISAGFTVQANSIQGIAESTLVSNTINYNVAGLLNHLAKDINDLIPGTAYSGTQVTGKAYTDATTDILNLDTNISSEYTDSALGTRPEDIIIAGGKYIDTYSSHAPEELVPGQVIDSLQMNVFTAKVVNGVPDYTNIIGYKIFTDYKLPTVYYRISAEYSTVLSVDLNYDDTEIFVNNIAKLPEPNRIQNQPGSIWINGERINYFGRDVATGKLTDIRRGASRTSIPLLHPAGVIITDASPSQEVTRDTVLTITSDVSVNNGLGDTATYQSVITPTVPQGKIWLET